ncbi:MAG TPA: tRNA lysidine(34) synthetase TilS, partial [Thermoanaerobaculia bacterium]
RSAGAAYPAGAAAARELFRQLGGGANVQCDCGGGWCWREDGEHVALLRAGNKKSVPEFTYTLNVPGDLWIPEAAMRMRLRFGLVEPWMFRGASDRAGLALPLADGGRVTIRNRRAGDRIHPLGAAGGRRLKEILIDRRLPRWERERLPLLCWENRIAWVPGVTIDEHFRIGSETSAWIAEISTP